MKNIYFIQINNLLSNSILLPYSVGAIAAYSFQHETIKKDYHLCDFIFMKQNIDELISDMKSPYIVAFSCYMWNIEYNLALAKKIKENWPECTIVFGGPQIPNTTEYLESYDYIDVLIYGEGERPFYLILKQKQNNNDFSQIANISYRNENQIVKTKEEAPYELENFPSPYVMGLFDNIVNDSRYESLKFDAVLETNRGCPYGCAYCYYARSGASFREFPLQRVKEDIEWIAKHKTSYCICADSNFGILERDQEVANFVIEMKKKYGYPDVFETSAAKNKSELTFKINYSLQQYNLNRGVSVSVQSMSPEVLEIIGRKNISIESFVDLLKRYRENNMNAYTEFILGLPGETKESFCKGLFDIIEAGQHYAIAVYRCEFFPNTPLYSKEMREKYKIKTIVSKLCQKHSCIDEDHTFASRSCVIVETSTMSRLDWYESYRVAICLLSFHCMGLLRFFAVYLRKAKNVSYHDFYMNLYEWIKNESKTVRRLLDRTCDTFEGFFKGEGNLYFADERFGNIYWDFDDGMFLCCAAEAEAFYADVSDYLKRYFDDDALYEDLFKYQKERIESPGAKAKTVITEYDWHNYFEHIFDDSVVVPEKKQSILHIAESETQTWDEYARAAVWYGKRNGKMLNKVINE